MADVEAPPAESARHDLLCVTQTSPLSGLGSRKDDEMEIAVEQEPILEPEKKRRRKKKKKKSKSKKEEPKDVDLEEAIEEFEGMPQAWVDCKSVMAAWLLFTFLIFGLCLITIPIGCILAFVASFIYFSKRGTKLEYGGQYLARTIYIIAFWAWSYDMVIFALTLLSWVVLIYGVCDDYDHNICLFRVSVGYFVSAQMCMVFVHATLSFTAFLKMRDCCKDIILDEREAKERFADMEKQIYEEFRQKRKDELASKKKKSSKTSQT